jgi:hypothetical protein
VSSGFGIIPGSQGRLEEHREEPHSCELGQSHVQLVQGDRRTPVGDFLRVGYREIGRIGR